MHPSNTSRYQRFYLSEKLNLKDELLITLRSVLVQTGIPAPTFLSGRCVERQSKQPDHWTCPRHHTSGGRRDMKAGSRCGLLCQRSPKFAVPFYNVAARKGEPKDANVMQIVHRAVRMLQRLHKCTKQHQLLTQFFFTRHPIILGSLLRRKSRNSMNGLLL